MTKESERGIIAQVGPMFSRRTAMMDQTTVDVNRDPNTFSVLIGQLKDPDPNLRLQAAGKLRKFLDYSEIVVPALVHTLNDEDRNVRFAALTSLGNMGAHAQDAIPALRTIMEIHPDKGLRQVVSWVLEKLDPGTA